jgi:hypothetical protein
LILEALEAGESALQVRQNIVIKPIYLILFGGPGGWGICPQVRKNAVIKPIYLIDYGGPGGWGIRPSG